jgi:hypothetical protein
MDSGSTMIGVWIIVLTILPFIIAYFFKKMKEKKLQKNFLSLAEKEKVVISQKDFWKKCYSIGIDTDSKKLLYFNKRLDKERGTLIDLSQIEKCRVVHTDKHLKSQNGNSNLTNKLELVFTFNNSGIPEKSLEFYNNPEFMPTVDDFSHIENWLNIVNSNLKNVKN